MLYIYILELIDNKYYIGKTSNPDFRLETHFNIGESVWTIKYKPIKLIELITGCDNFDEDKYTLKYMEKYGIENVRGGSFCQINLSQENINTINKMLLNSTKSINNNTVKSKYDEYLDKFDNLQKTNNEIIKLENQYEYMIQLNSIFNNIYNEWVNTFKQLNDSISCFNKNNISKQYIMREFGRMNLPSAKINLLFADKNENEMYDIYMNLCFFFANKNHEQLLKNVCHYEKNNEVFNIIGLIFLSKISSVKHWILDLKTKFAERIDDSCINYDVFEKLENFNLNIRMNKILLFKLQLEKELERIYKIHQVENFNLYELEVNKKMELLTSRMIELTIQV